MHSHKLILIGLFCFNAFGNRVCPLPEGHSEQIIAKLNTLFSDKSLLGEDGSEEHYETLAVSGCETSIEAIFYPPQGDGIHTRFEVKVSEEQVRVQMFQHSKKLESFKAELKPVSKNLILLPTEEDSTFISRECVRVQGRTKCRHAWYDENGAPRAILLREIPLK